MSRPRRRKLRGPLGDFVAIIARRRCCFCFAHQADFGVKPGQIAHIDHDRTNDSPSNLAYLCLPHHNEYDSGTSQAKGLTPGELRACKKALEDEVRRQLPGVEPPETRPRSSGGRPTCADIDQYRQDLLAVGAGFILDEDAAPLLTAVSTSGGPDVQRMVEHGQFEDESGRELLILPPTPEYVQAVEDALKAVARRKPALASPARRLRREVKAYRIVLEADEASSNE